jgi:hypothetical protein
METLELEEKLLAKYKISAFGITYMQRLLNIYLHSYYAFVDIRYENLNNKCGWDTHIDITRMLLVQI